MYEYNFQSVEINILYIFDNIFILKRFFNLYINNIYQIFIFSYFMIMKKIVSI